MKHKSPLGLPHAAGHVCTTPPMEIIQAKPKICKCYIPVPMEKCKHGARSNLQRTCRFSTLAVPCQALHGIQKQFPTCFQIILQNSHSSNNAEYELWMKQNLVQPECFCQVSLLTTTHWSAGSSAAIWLRSQSAFLLSLFLAFVLFLFSLLFFFHSSISSLL